VQLLAKKKTLWVTVVAGQLLAKKKKTLWATVVAGQ